MPPPHVDRIIWAQAHALLEDHRDRGQDEIVSFYPPEMEAERDRLAIAYAALDGATSSPSALRRTKHAGADASPVARRVPGPTLGNLPVANSAVAARASTW